MLPRTCVLDITEMRLEMRGEPSDDVKDSGCLSADTRWLSLLYGRAWKSHLRHPVTLAAGPHSSSGEGP